MSPVCFFKKSDDFINELSDYLEGKTVLEVFAGNGYLSSLLREKGIQVHATSLFSGHDGHANGLFFPVEEMDAEQAVSKYGQEYDVLLISWPVVSNKALKALRRWGSEKPVVYIGEVTDRSLPGALGLGGCADDEFFESIVWEREFRSYSGNMLERAGVIYEKEK